jgi:hypothetical protein
MSARHTPGPWTVVVALIHSEPSRFQIQAGATHIATIPALDAAAAANARLISAAPDMLTALEAILDVGLSERTFALGFKTLAKARDQGETG